MTEYQAEILKWIEYDTLKVVKAEELNTKKLFSQPLNIKKTKLDTNMYLIETLPLPQHFNCTHLNVIYGELNTLEDNKRFKDSARYEFFIGYKCHDEGPFSRFQTWELASFDEQLIKLIQEKEGLNTFGGKIDYRIGNEPIGHHILKGQQFYFRIIADEGFIPNQDFKLVIILEGVISRGVQ